MCHLFKQVLLCNTAEYTISASVHFTSLVPTHSHIVPRYANGWVPDYHFTWSSFFVSVMHTVSKGNQGAMMYSSIPCIQLCKKADDEIGLNPITADISSSNGHVVIFKDGLLDESKMLLQVCSKTECMACIFINSSDTLDLTVTSSDVNFNDYNFPIYLLRKDHGLKLLDQMMINVSKVSIRTKIVQQSQKQQCECFRLVNYFSCLILIQLFITDIDDCMGRHFLIKH